MQNRKKERLAYLTYEKCIIHCTCTIITMTLILPLEHLSSVMVSMATVLVTHTPLYCLIYSHSHFPYSHDVHFHSIVDGISSLQYPIAPRAILQYLILLSLW